MESSIAVFLLRQPACERLPTSIHLCGLGRGLVRLPSLFNTRDIDKYAHWLIAFCINESLPL